MSWQTILIIVLYVVGTIVFFASAAIYAVAIMFFASGGELFKDWIKLK